MSSFIPPPGYSRIKLVNSFDALVTTRFIDGVNALCWPRELPGDFAEVLRHLPATEGITALDDEELESLPVTEAGRLAIEFMLNDLRLLRAHDLDPELNHVNGFLRDADPGPVRTDVASFHADSATVEADTWLCTYLGPTSEGLRNEEAIRRIDVPETRAALMERFGGRDDESFRSHLSDHCYDLHYVPQPGARPFPFGPGNLWRIATEHPGCAVPPCIHRAPDTAVGQRRLLLIS